MDTASAVNIYTETAPDIVAPPTRKLLTRQMEAIGSFLMPKFKLENILSDINQVNKAESGEFIWVVQKHTSMVFCRRSYKSREDMKFAGQWLEALLFSPFTKAVLCGFIEFNVIEEIQADKALEEFRSWQG